MVSWPFAASLAAAVAPADQITGNITTYILGYGVLGVVAIAFAFRFIVPRSAVEDARKEARADLLDQITRLERHAEQLVRDKKDVEEQRDEALKFSQSNLIPLLVNFTNATSALLPILQQVVQHQEGGGTIDPRRRSR